MEDILDTYILKVRDVSKVFGGLCAINHLNFEISPGEILGIIGPNGSGKTTLFNLICGFLHPSAGSIWFKGQNITGFAPHRIPSLGIGRTFQNLRPFANLSVLENVMLGRHLHSRAGMVEAAFRLPRFRIEERNIVEVAMAKLTMVGLRDEAAKFPLDLPYGKQKTLEMARALALEPKLLLVDEPAGGLSSHEIGELGQFIRMVRNSGVTVLLVEHRMELVMNVSDRVIVLNYGEKIAEDSPAGIRTNEKAIEAYLGKEV